MIYDILLKRSFFEVILKSLISLPKSFDSENQSYHEFQKTNLYKS